MPLGLANCYNINSDPLASIKRLFSVPRCCVLLEDKVSGLTMHGKPVALSRGATVVLFFVIFQGSFGHFYALSEFSMHLCA